MGRLAYIIQVGLMWSQGSLQEAGRGLERKTDVIKEAKIGVDVLWRLRKGPQAKESRSPTRRWKGRGTGVSSESLQKEPGLPSF
jgi:hypothetical protein